MASRNPTEWDESTASGESPEDLDDLESPASEEGEKAPLSEGVIELARLGRRWLDLTLQQALYTLRAHLSESLTLFGLFILGGLLVLGGIAILDVLIYNWLSAALASKGWALFSLSMFHIAVGGILIRVTWIHLRGDDTP